MRKYKQLTNEVKCLDFELNGHVDFKSKPRCTLNSQIYETLLLNLLGISLQSTNMDFLNILTAKTV